MSTSSSTSNLLCAEVAYGAAFCDADRSTPTSLAPCYHSLSDNDDDDDFISALLDAELPHMPKSGYLQRFHDRSLDATARQDAVHEYYRFSSVTAYLSVIYLDRFLSSHTLPVKALSLTLPEIHLWSRESESQAFFFQWQRGNGWPSQLLAVACLSIAAKMEETEVPLLMDFQLFEPLFVFRPCTIGRMELLIMSRLKWRMRSVTPFDFVDSFSRKLPSFAAPHVFCSYRFFSRVSDLILSTHRVIDFLGYRPSTIAAAAVICAAGEIGDGTDAAIFCRGLDQEMVGRCRQLMEEYLIDTCPSGAKAGEEPALLSPVGVLDAAACGSCDTQQSACGAAGAS
ncbi:hypothetical protein ACLOJK_036011 [Asimina triloba]